MIGRSKHKVNNKKRFINFADEKKKSGDENK